MAAAVISAPGVYGEARRKRAGMRFRFRVVFRVVDSVDFLPWKFAGLR